MHETAGGGAASERTSADTDPQPTAGGGRRPIRADARRNRERLLAAAHDVFVDQGIDAPLEEVARRAGVGIATLYRRFPDRQALIRAVALKVLTQVADEARAALADEPDAFAALRRYLHRALDLRIAAVMPVLSGELDLERDSELRAARDALAPLFEAMVDTAHRDRLLRSDVGSGDIGLMIIRLARPLPLPIGRIADDAAAHRHLDILLDGMRAQARATDDVVSDRSAQRDSALTVDGLRRLPRRGRDGHPR